jgi:hypothetical protein
VKGFAVLLAVPLLAACGSSVRTVTRVERVDTGCNGIAADLTIHYAICGGHRFTRDGRRIPIGNPPGAKIGHWAKAFLSPDLKTFLAEWSAECEVPLSFFVPARGGVPQPVAGGKKLSDVPVSSADGWTADGRAIVEFPNAACGTSIRRPGVYFISLTGRRQLVAPLPRSR